MVLNHLAAIFFFSGPLLYIGMVLVAFPSTFVWLPELMVRRLMDGTEEGIHRRRIRRASRLAGAGLVVGGILFGAIA